MMKIKIVHIVEAFATGIFQYLVDLCNNLSQEYEIVIAYGLRNETPDNFKEYFNKNIKFVEIKNFRRKIGFRDFLAYNEIKKIINDENPDIIHLHSSKAGFLGRWGIKNKLIFYTPHGYSFMQKDISSTKVKLYKLLEEKASKRNGNSVILACSKGEYEEAKKISSNVECVKNGIDIKTLETIVEKFEKNDNINIRICTVGRIEKQKNPKMFNQIAEAFPNIDFTWIGDGKLKTLLTSNNISVTGYLKREDAIRELMKNDVFILTSLWEGLSISLLEAMYLKKICVVSNLKENNEIINNNCNGYIAEDLQKYITCINEIINTCSLDTLRNNAKKTVEQYYFTERMCEEYKKIIRNYYKKK